MSAFVGQRHTPSGRQLMQGPRLEHCVASASLDVLIWVTDWTPQTDLRSHHLRKSLEIMP